MATRRRAPAPGVRRRLVTMREGALAFEVLSKGAGAPLVYFHSYHERGGWPALLDRLASRTSVRAPIHPGVAGSAGVERLDDLFDLILAYDELLTALRVRSAHLVGHAFGGMVAAEMAAVFPHRARTLTLVSPLGLWHDERPSADVLILPPDELMAALWRDPQSEVARAWAALPRTEQENIEAQIESIARRAAMGKFAWPIPDRGIGKRLHRIAAPTLVLWGEDDRANPVSYAGEWQRLVKGAALRLVPGGHMVEHESPDAVATAILEHIQ